MEDTNNRIAAIVINKDNQVLIGHAPNFRKGMNTWDLVGKGHISENEDPDAAVVRELFEESGISLKSAKPEKLGTVPYKSGKMTFYLIRISDEELPTKLVCNSFFDWNGKKFPEISEFMWVDKGYLITYLYKSLAAALRELYDAI